MTHTDALIDELADGASSVRPRTTAAGRAWLALVAAATLSLVYTTFGFRDDIMAGQPAPMLGITAGLLILLAAAAGAGAVRMARPQVGAPHSGAPWVLAALALVPAIATVGILTSPALSAGLEIHQGMRCLRFGLASSLGAFGFLTMWLRRGAPVSPERASWLAGIAAGATGALAITLECPQESLAHLAFWHLGAVPIAAVAGRLVLPRFLRW